MPPLQRAVALAEVDDVAVCVGEDLELDVAGADGLALEQQAGVAERGERFRGRRCERGGARTRPASRETGRRTRRRGSGRATCTTSTACRRKGASPADKNQYGIDIGSDWTRVKGVEVANANDTGILVQGAHDFVELCDVHDSADTGIKISSSSGFTGSGTFNTILNCDSHHNNDPQCNGANADGFGAKEGGGDGNVFDGCRSWDNADDGWDLFAWTSPVTVRNSWAFNMGATTSGSMSNGNGFKMGGNGVSAVHVMSNLFGFDNNGNGGHASDWGFTNNSNPASMTCRGCGAWNNKGGSFQSISHTGDVAMPAGITSAKAAAAKRNADGSLPAITSL